MTYARFETLIGDQDELGERRRRLMTSAVMALTLSMAAGTMMWLGDKMGISMVSPPKNVYQVTLNLSEAPPPPQAPPQAPAAAAETKDDGRSAAPDEVMPEPDEAPLEVFPLDLERSPRPRSSGPSDGATTGGGGGGPSIGVPSSPFGSGTCLLPPCMIDAPPRRPPPPKPADDPIVKPIASVMARVISSPNPDQKALAQTPTGRTHRSSGRTTVSFCIDKGGRTFDVRTRKHFRGDPQVDQICRKTVSKWRFAPLVVNGRKRSSCTTVSFDIRFD